MGASNWVVGEKFEGFFLKTMSQSILGAARLIVLK